MFSVLIVIFHFFGRLQRVRLCQVWLPVCLCLFVFYFSFQIQNADDVLITPLEKFRKEQIGAAKVGDHLHTQLAIERRRMFHVFWQPRFSSSPPSSPLQYVNY